MAQSDQDAAAIAAKKPSVVMIYGDDWQGLYIDGRLKTEGHKISVCDFATHVCDLGKFEFDGEDADQDWLEDRGSLPKNLSEVKIST
jgi:hypothetical protein